MIQQPKVRILVLIEGERNCSTELVQRSAPGGNRSIRGGPKKARRNQQLRPKPLETVDVALAPTPPGRHVDSKRCPSCCTHPSGALPTNCVGRRPVTGSNRKELRPDSSAP